MGLELLLDRFGELPKRDAFRWIKYFTTAMRSDREYGTSLCKVMDARKISSGRGSANSAKLSAGAPPLSDIHFVKSSNDQSKFQQAIEIHSWLRHWPRVHPNFQLHAFALRSPVYRDHLRVAAAQCDQRLGSCTALAIGEKLKNRKRSASILCLSH
jgi:hypothetical protein